MTTIMRYLYNNPNLENLHLNLISTKMKPSKLRCLIAVALVMGLGPSIIPQAAAIENEGWVPPYIPKK
jgi:hypothetical protein